MSFTTPPPVNTSFDEVDSKTGKATGRISRPWLIWIGQLFSYLSTLSISGGVSQILAGSNVIITPAGGTGVVTVNATSSGGGINRVIQNVSANITAGAVSGTDYAFNASNSANVTLPTAVGNTNLYTVKKTDTSAVQVLFTGGQNADGTTAITFPIQNMELGFLSDGANWRIQ